MPFWLLQSWSLIKISRDFLLWTLRLQKSVYYSFVLLSLTMESIKHSVSNFMDILLIASTKGVIKWDTQMFDCALAWAIYCEQV